MRAPSGEPIPIVYILIPCLFASLALFNPSPSRSSPSDIKMRNLSRSSLEKDRDASSIGDARFVPPALIVPISRFFKVFIKAWWSKVKGHCRKAFPANAIKPIRSPFKSPIKLEILSLTRSNLLGRMSLANMLLETSIATNKSIPVGELVL